ncbi:hypothetical protein ACE3MZ_16855 [Paenibacillus sp. WLX1005]|uniref:hypothetical protein n=1 Tax=Paenibacillus sp. WLX1005 TaxID=3243766 RepID=UPI003984301E
MIIEKATLSNLEEVTNLAMQLWSHSVETDLKLEFKEILESVTSIVYVASVDNRSIGFIQVSLRND